PGIDGVAGGCSDGITAVGAGQLESVDPGGGIAAATPARQVIGCVVHASAATAAPGIALHRMGRGLIIGEPGGGTSARVRTLGELLTRAGFEVTCSQRIRYDVWYKLWR